MCDAFDVWRFELTGDIVLVERQEALDVSHRHGRGQGAKIEPGVAAMKVIRVGRVDANRSRGDVKRGAIGCGVRLRDERLGRGDRSARAKRVGLVVQIHGVGALERVRPARKMVPKVQVEIEGQTSRDVRLPIGPIEPARQVQAGH